MNCVPASLKPLLFFIVFQETENLTMYGGKQKPKAVYQTQTARED